MVSALQTWPGGDRKPRACAIPGPGTERRENLTKRWRWASDRGRDKWGSRRARQTGNPSEPGRCPETLLLLLPLAPCKGAGRSGDLAREARRHAPAGGAPALLAAILALGSHLTAGGSAGARTAPAARPRRARPGSGTKGRDAGSLGPGLEGRGAGPASGAAGAGAPLSCPGGAPALPSGPCRAKGQRGTSLLPPASCAVWLSAPPQARPRPRASVSLPL